VARGLAPQTSSLCGGIIIGLVNNAFKPVTALLAATQRGPADIVDLLLQHGAYFSAAAHPSKFTTMEYAVPDESSAIVRSLGKRLFNPQSFPQS